MKISARNSIPGVVSEIKLGAVAAQVRIDIGNDTTLTSMITVDAVKDLDIKVGDDINAVVKATEVMLSK